MSFVRLSSAGGFLCVSSLAIAASTTGDGAFSSAQAERGQLVYDGSCVSCHDRQYYEEKLAVWQGATIGDLFFATSATMPLENPATLTDQQYLDVLAYIFSITGSPAGDEELTLTNMDAIEIVFPVAAPAAGPAP